MIIRDAHEDDTLQLCQLLSQLNYDMDLNTMETRIQAFQQDRHHLLVIEQNHHIIAAIAFGCYEQLRLPGCCCHIDALIIHHDHRNQGLGKKLVAVAEEYALKYGAKTIALTSANHRIKNGTHAFYDALGYKNHVGLDCAYFAKENRQE
ncbi:MAG: GNAT family N-acetyltransferase [Legionellaceae bacterium]|nr:GNAT family N-acetyltransferase [Legionellaceae bacterium]